MNRRLTIILAMLLAGACRANVGNDSANDIANDSGNHSGPAPEAPAAPQPPASPQPPSPPQPPSAPAAPGRPSLPNDRTPLEEPQGPIDPRSAEAAGQVVQHLGALIEQKRFSEAEQLWGNNSAQARAFTAMIAKDKEAHLEVGKPHNMEGAAGSSYITVPVVLYGKHADGHAFRRGGDATLRRVNDVPGSTAAQRRWHIERIVLVQ